MHIVYEETKRMLRGMLPLALVTFGVFALCGQGIARSGASVLLGTAFALLLFYMIGRSTVRATAFPPAQGIRITRRGYVVRYMLTAVFVIAAIKLPYVHLRGVLVRAATTLPYLNAAAAVIPLFFTKALLLWRHAVQQKGG